MNCQEFSNELQKMLETGITLSSPKLTQHMISYLWHKGDWKKRTKKEFSKIFDKK